MTGKMCPLSKSPGDKSGFSMCIQDRCALFDESECAIKGLSSIAESLFAMLKNDNERNTVYEAE